MSCPPQSKIRANVINDLAEECHKISKEHGFWPEGKERNFGESLCLVHSEISECLEGMRKGNIADEHCPKFSSCEIEISDAIIRLMDLCHGMGYDLGGALIAKMEFNRGRAMLHGKAF